MTTLILAEKPSQARDLRAALGASAGQILAAEGHLLTLEEPEDVNPAWKRWSTDVLAPPGGRYRTTPARGGNKSDKLRAIAAALKGASTVVIATDCDREGQLIGQEILEHYKFRGTVLRAIYTAQDPETVRTAFGRLRPNAEYQNMYLAALARQQADQIFNLSLTRAATVSLVAPGSRGVIGVGRVKTPTLGIVCRRELEIRNFRPVTYYEVHATARVTGGTFRMRYAPDPRLHAAADAERVRSAADGARGPLEVTVEDKRRAPPRLFDLPALQKACASRWGWTASRTLEVAQELYDGEGKKLITYPRAESRYLAEVMIGEVPRLLAGLGGLPAYAAHVPAAPVIRRGKGGVFSDAGLAGVSHHAVIPNVNTVERAPEILARCSEDERRLFDLVARAYVAAMLPDYLYRQTVAVLRVNAPASAPPGEGPYAFEARGAVPTSLGWRVLYLEPEPAKRSPATPGTQGDGGAEPDPSGDGTGAGADEDTLLPPLAPGQPASLEDPVVATLQTKPPPRYHEGGLIEAMQNAWKFVDDPATRERLREAKGIGTPATRAHVIDGLKAQQFLKIQGKHIVPTDSGLALYEVLVAAAPTVVDPGTTASWELRLDAILEGAAGADDVIGEITAAAGQLITQLTRHAGAGGQLVAAAGGKARAPTPAMLAFAKRLAEQQGLKLPKGCTSDGAVCRAFLDAHAPKTPGADGAAAGPRAPSEKALAFAHQLATQQGLSLPADALGDSRSLSAWIDAHKSTPRPASSTAAGRPAGPTRSTGGTRTGAPSAAAGATQLDTRDPRFTRTPTDKACPKCKQGRLVTLQRRDGRAAPFYACEQAGCGFYLTVGLRKRARPCPACGEAVFERRQRNGGTFWSCVMAPGCAFREEASPPPAATPAAPGRA